MPTPDLLKMVKAELEEEGLTVKIDDLGPCAAYLQIIRPRDNEPFNLCLKGDQFMLVGTEPYLYYRLVADPDSLTEIIRRMKTWPRSPRPVYQSVVEK